MSTQSIFSTRDVKSVNLHNTQHTILTAQHTHSTTYPQQSNRSTHCKATDLHEYSYTASNLIETGLNLLCVVVGIHAHIILTWLYKFPTNKLCRLKAPSKSIITISGGGGYAGKGWALYYQLKGAAFIGLRVYSSVTYLPFSEEILTYIVGISGRQAYMTCTLQLRDTQVNPKLSCDLTITISILKSAVGSNVVGMVTCSLLRQKVRCHRDRHITIVTGGFAGIATGLLLQ